MGPGHPLTSSDAGGVPAVSWRKNDVRSSLHGPPRDLDSRCDELRHPPLDSIVLDGGPSSSESTRSRSTPIRACTRFLFRIARYLKRRAAAPLVEPHGLRRGRRGPGGRSGARRSAKFEVLGQARRPKGDVAGPGRGPSRMEDDGCRAVPGRPGRIDRGRGGSRARKVSGQAGAGDVLGDHERGGEGQGLEEGHADRVQGRTQPLINLAPSNFPGP